MKTALIFAATKHPGTVKKSAYQPILIIRALEKRILEGASGILRRMLQPVEIYNQGGE
jgi:hypothetical protein